jgi:ERF superfamily protein
VIDRDTGLIRLTTTLVHASGEWVSSDWPVCPASETAAPHRMGAALTYARRYALFTLVGIAGEDDLDAPDLAASGEPDQTLGSYPGSVSRQAENNQPAEADRSQRKPSAPAISKPIFDPEQSVKLREALIAELERLGSPDDAAVWAHRNLAAKNTLTAADANAVENAFAQRLSGIAQAPPAAFSTGAQCVPPKHRGPPLARRRGAFAGTPDACADVCPANGGACNRHTCRSAGSAEQR